MTQNVLKLLYPFLSQSYFGLLSGSRIWLKGTSVFWKPGLCQETLVQNASGSLWEVDLVLGLDPNSGDDRKICMCVCAFMYAHTYTHIFVYTHTYIYISKTSTPQLVPALSIFFTIWHILR